MSHSRHTGISLLRAYLFAGNHGADLTTVFNGLVTVTPGAGGSMPGLWYVDLQLTTPFLYDPTTGSGLAIDFRVSGASGSGGIVDHVTTGAAPPPFGSRIWDSNADAHTRTNATFVNQNFAPVCEFVYEPLVGLWPNFDATPRTGPVPLLVQFSDRSITDAPGGIMSYQWRPGDFADARSPGLILRCSASAHMHPVLASFVLFVLSADPPGDDPPPGPPWLPSHREACRDALLHGRPVFVYFTKTY
jgi:hypothetical protein